MPAGLTALEGEVEVDGGDVLLIEGLMDDASGKFVAAGVDSQGLGLGIQVEGYWDDTAAEAEQVTVVVKEKDQDTGEWAEEEFTPDPDNSVVITGTPSPGDAGLPPSWLGKYRLPAGALGFGDDPAMQNISADEISKRSFVIITPAGFSVDADYDSIDAYVKTVNGADATAVKATVKTFLDSLYVSFLEFTELAYSDNIHPYMVRSIVKQDTGSQVTKKSANIKFERNNDTGEITLALEVSGSDGHGDGEAPPDFNSMFTLTKWDWAPSQP